jgi:hypothetical protein
MTKVMPVARGYELRVLKCPNCTNVLKLVIGHPRPNQKTLARHAALTRDWQQNGRTMDHISWSDLNSGEQRAIAVLAAGMPIQLCDAAALVTMRRAGLVKGSSLTIEAEKLRRSVILKALVA